jgi:hypothetical protein
MHVTASAHGSPFTCLFEPVSNYGVLVLKITKTMAVAMTCLLDQRQRQVDPVLQDMFEDKVIGMFDVGYLRGY